MPMMLFVILIICTRALWGAICGDAVTAFTCAFAGVFLVFAELSGKEKAGD